MAKARLQIIPLGGLGEIGKNMTVFRYGDEIIELMQAWPFRKKICWELILSFPISVI